MYLNAHTVGDEVFVWERTETGRVTKTYPAPYYFYIRSKRGEFQSIYGDKLDRYDFQTRREFNDAKSQCQKRQIEMFESDLSCEVKVLSEHYYNQPIVFPNVTFFDIEVDYDPVNGGFSGVDNPYGPINSVAFYHTWLKKYVVLTVPPTPGAETQLGHDLHQLAEIIVCKDEKQLLKHFVKQIQDCDILSGWNSSLFDVPYVAKRLQLTFGEDGPNYLCFPDAPGVRWGEVEIYGRTNITIELGGRVALDYLQLFKKYTTVDRSSFKLESIADDYLPELPKIKYDGTLSDLYRNDYSKFTRYNIRDTEILKHLEDKLKYMSLANDIVHMTTAQFKHVTGTLKLAELAIVNFCHHELKQIVNDNDIDEDNTSTVQGAYVLEPKTGLHEWVVTLDINSLYPSVIMGINISPETIIGQMNLYEQSVDLIKNGDTTIAITLMYDDKSREHETYTGNQWNEILWERKWSISGYGTIFTQEQKGCIPMILDSWFSLRKKYQKQKEQAEIKMKEILSTAAKRQKSVDV